MPEHKYPIKPRPILDICPSCHGRGWKIWESAARWVMCGHCSGRGWVFS